MDLSNLRRGDRVRTAEGAIAQVLAESEDGRWIRIRYVEGTDDLDLLGTEDLCEEAEIVEVVAKDGAP